MKKNLFIAVSTLFLASAFASCQKTYTCECTAKDGSGVVSTYLTKKTTKKQAEEVCTTGTDKEDCKLK